MASSSPGLSQKAASFLQHIRYVYTICQNELSTTCRHLTLLVRTSFRTVWCKVAREFFTIGNYLLWCLTMPYVLVSTQVRLVSTY